MCHRHAFLLDLTFGISAGGSFRGSLPYRPPTTVFDLVAESAQDLLCLLPTNAGVGDRDTVPQPLDIRGVQLLVPLKEVTLHHETADALVACHDLVSNVGEHQALVFVVFARVAMGAVDADTEGEASRGELLLHLHDVLG